MQDWHINSVIALRPSNYSGITQWWPPLMGHSPSSAPSVVSASGQWPVPGKKARKGTAFRMPQPPSSLRLWTRDGRLDAPGLLRIRALLSHSCSTDSCLRTIGEEGARG